LTPEQSLMVFEELLAIVEESLGTVALLRSAGSDSELRAEALATDLKHQQRAVAALEKRLASLQRYLSAEVQRDETSLPVGGRPRAKTSVELEREIVRLHYHERLGRRAIFKYLSTFRLDLMRLPDLPGGKHQPLTDAIVRRVLEDHRRAKTLG
jgi:hypothetical protein